MSLEHSLARSRVSGNGQYIIMVVLRVISVPDQSSLIFRWSFLSTKTISINHAAFRGDKKYTYRWIREFKFDVGVNLFGIRHRVANALNNHQLQVVLPEIGVALQYLECSVLISEPGQFFPSQVTCFDHCVVPLGLDCQLLKPVGSGNISGGLVMVSCCQTQLKNFNLVDFIQIICSKNITFSCFFKSSSNFWKISSDSPGRHSPGETYSKLSSRLADTLGRTGNVARSTGRPESVA
jgi:hypothetical protein